MEGKGLGQPGRRQDDKSIPDDEALYRRIIDSWIVTEQGSGKKRLASAAFKDSRREISVELSSLTTLQECWARRDERHVGIMSVTAGEARGLGQAVVRDALLESPAHALICGNQPESVSKRLAALARWVHPLDASPFC